MQPQVPDTPVSWVYGLTSGILVDYRLGRVLGQDALSITRVAVQRSTGEEFACKCVSKQAVMKQDARCGSSSWTAHRSHGVNTGKKGLTLEVGLEFRVQG